MTTGRLATQLLAAGSTGLVIILLGCAENASTPPSETGSTAEPGQRQSTGERQHAASQQDRTGTSEADQKSLPTASIGTAAEGGEENPTPRDETPSEQAEMKAILREMAALRSKPIPQKGDPETTRSIRRRRHEKIIERATEIIAETHGSPDTKSLFNAAVRFLMEARLALALRGLPHHVDALYEDAESLYERAPDSEAAADAAFVRARFAHTNVRRFADEEPRWLQEFARQARLFADRFPQHGARAASLLYAAAWACERHGLVDKARQCYSRIRSEFPDTPQAEQAVAVLRRLRLPGQSLELAGPTLNGDFVSIDDYTGRPVLVVFWTSDDEKFPQQAKLVNSLAEKQGEMNPAVLGVCLDEDETAVEQFRREHGLTWPQIFYSDPSKRGGDNPIVRYYGIRDTPTFWLVGPDGTVVDTDLPPNNLEAALKQLNRDQSSETG